MSGRARPTAWVSRGPPRRRRGRGECDAQDAACAGRCAWRAIHFSACFLSCWPGGTGPTRDPSSTQGRVCCCNHRTGTGPGVKRPMAAQSPKPGIPHRQQRQPPLPRSCSRSSPLERPSIPTPKPRSCFRATFCPTTTTRSRSMREVDDALSRAYAQRGAASPPSGVTPTPHWSSRTPEHEATSPSSGSEARSARTASTGRRTVTWHRHGESGGEPARASQSIDPAAIQELQWPGIVLVLEREWSHRFDQMADRLIESRDRQNIKVLLFTSCHRAEGRTTLVLTLARALARRPGRTVLVDADLTGPMLAHALGLHPEFGLDDVVTAGHALADALIHAPDNHLWILPLRVAAASPREFLASPGWSCTMARLRREFDLVLVDGSPIFTGLSAAVLHRAVDAAILVHSRSMTGERSLLRAREVLDAGGIPLLGLAETFV